MKESERRRETEIKNRKKGRFADAVLLALKLKDEAMSQGMQMASRSGKGQGCSFSPRADRRNTALTTSDFRTSDIQNCMIIDLYCSKLLNLWYFVIARIEN